MPFGLRNWVSLTLRSKWFYITGTSIFLMSNGSECSLASKCYTETMHWVRRCHPQLKRFGRKAPVSMSSDWPSIVEALRSLQGARKPTASRPLAGSRIGFALSSRDRFVFTLRTIKALDSESTFDLVWNDGSDRPEGPQLSRYYVFKSARLVETNYGVKGGADAAIC